MSIVFVSIVQPPWGTVSSGTYFDAFERFERLLDGNAPFRERLQVRGIQAHDGVFAFCKIFKRCAHGVPHQLVVGAGLPPQYARGNGFCQFEYLRFQRIEKGRVRFLQRHARVLEGLMRFADKLSEMRKASLHPGVVSSRLRLLINALGPRNRRLVFQRIKSIAESFARSGRSTTPPTSRSGAASSRLRPAS